MTRPVQPMSVLASIAIFCMGVVSRQQALAENSPAVTVEFNRDIRPLLSDRCFSCHGPDAAKRAADVRLDHRESAVRLRDGARAIVPFHAAESEVVRRIESSDAGLRMPPPSSGAELTHEEINLLKRWIDEGAEYQPHWSFVPPQRRIPPPTAHTSHARGPIDDFVGVRLDRVGLKPTSEADPATLIRRISFDLIGLPPTIEEIDEFLQDSSPDAYEKLVDRLLASPRYGERMASPWLDAARFADTNGYQTDGPRFMWRWRDWVIEAFNDNVPFDQLTIDQLAGDIVESHQKRVPSRPGELNGSPTASPSNHPSAIANSRLIATGFNRNHRGNAEGGIIPEEFRIEYVVDRVETTSTVWLGLTIGCARCHDHKYDPVSQREFYQLFAFFNQVPEPGKYIRNGNSMPYLPAPTPDQQRHLTALDQDRAVAEVAWQKLAPEVTAGMKGLAESIQMQSVPVDWIDPHGLDSHLPFDGNLGIAGNINRIDTASRIAKDLQVEVDNGQSSLELSGQWRDGDPQFGPGRIGQAANFDGKSWIDAGIAGYLGEEEIFAISCWVNPSRDDPMTILARMDHENSSHGYELRREANGRLQVLLAGRILDDLIRVETQDSLPRDQWSHILVTYDGSSAARGVAVRINGESTRLTVLVDLLSNPIRAKVPLCIGGGGSAAPFVGMIDDVRIYRRRLTTEAARSLAAGDTLSEIASQTFETLGVNELEKLREFYLAEYAPESQRQPRQALLDASDRYDDFLASVPTTMVMEDAPIRRETRLLKRGEYDKPGEVVESEFPSVLSSSATGEQLPRSVPLNRLDLANWFVSPGNPLTARVTVNRLWQSLFGVGLVKTAEDFGVQGEAPSHPELLDWLALEFSESDRPQLNENAATIENTPVRNSSSASRPFAWDLKRSLRSLVCSATYRRTAKTTPEQLIRDPENRWLARGPRVRLTAEMVRDAALATSGLLVETLGGPSVKPYQPAGLWEELSAEAVPGPFSVYVQEQGANLYRRSLYTYRKRTVPPPAMTIFDSSTREACRVNLPRTNTPIQALNLMNDVTYVEAARVLAEQAIQLGGASLPSRLSWAFRRVLARSPSERELSVLVEGFEKRLKEFAALPAQVEQFVSQGKTRPDPSIPPVELAAYAATVSVLFNLDEFIMKP